MYLFLLPLLLGFACNLASAFTTAFARRWGARRGRLVTVFLRDVAGVPVWALGFGLAAAAPGPRLFQPGPVTDVTGWALAALGGGVIVPALFSLGRRAARPSIHDTLVQTGLYARVRHPIHAGTLLEFAGLILLRPSLPVALACAAGAGWVLLQTWLEERDLLQRLPDYADYMRRVPRFVPRLRRQDPGRNQKTRDQQAGGRR